MQITYGMDDEESKDEEDVDVLVCRSHRRIYGDDEWKARADDREKTLDGNIILISLTKGDTDTRGEGDDANKEGDAKGEDDDTNNINNKWVGYNIDIDRDDGDDIEEDLSELLVKKRMRLPL